jgi:centromere/kinetochore protein ZW10
LAFRKNFDRIILAPRFYPGKGNVVRALSVNSGDIRISGQISNITTERLFADLDLTIEYLGTCLPDSISNPLSEVLIPNLISQLISGTLSSSVPADLEGLHDFQATLQRVLRFSDVLKARGWKGQAELVAWAEDAPRVWLAKRSESSLHSMRQLLVRGLGNPRMVERVETQMVTQEDDLFAGDAKNDDWDAGWSDDDTHDTAHKPEASPALQENPALDSTEEVDVDAWGLGDDVAEGASESSHEKPAGVAQEDDDGTDAWGWGEGDDNHAIESPKASQISRHVQQTPRSNRHPSATAPTEREVILKETYNITALPEQILEIIIQAVEDADSLAKSASVAQFVAAGQITDY